ncbi:DUF4386 domain-containing protein [Longivirga aurantiaca]|uniref:DUF4386 domain-containing protein n=1 Tax=Longivirga aurantiaca TaxID=1837743 RepID=A0ABW1T0G9_9ACTN
MTTTAAPAVPQHDAARADLVRTARATGLLYLGVAITGGLGFLFVRTQLFVDGDPAATLANLVENPGLARLGVVLELGLVLTQVLCALWFFRLFRSVNSFAAGAIAVFGTVNAVALLGSAAALATAIDVAGGALDSPETEAATTQLLYLLSGNLWGVGALFFGLWLIPMGWLARRSGWMPAALGWLLIVSGVGYILNAFVTYAAPSAGALGDALTFPAALGELWMVGYLLVIGVRRTAVPA